MVLVRAPLSRFETRSQLTRSLADQHARVAELFGDLIKFNVIPTAS